MNSKSLSFNLDQTSFYVLANSQCFSKPLFTTLNDNILIWRLNSDYASTEWSILVGTDAA